MQTRLMSLLKLKGLALLLGICSNTEEILHMCLLYDIWHNVHQSIKECNPAYYYCSCMILVIMAFV